MFFPLCWLFNYVWVEKACIYGALTECEPVQLKCLKANAQSHKAIPLELLPSSTRLLMTAMCLPWREGPFARHWHMPGNSNWERVLCVKPATMSSFQRKSGVCGRKNTRLTPDATFGNLWALLLSHQPADLISAFLASLTRGSNWLWGRFLQPGDAHCGTQASRRLKGKETPWRDSTGSD